MTIMQQEQTKSFVQKSVHFYTLYIISELIYQIGKFLLMKVCMVGRVSCDFVCITQTKLQSTAYWYGWFVKVQLDIFVTCRFMIVNVDLLTETVGFLLEPYEEKGYHLYQDNCYNSVKQTNYYRN